MSFVNKNNIKFFLLMKDVCSIQIHKFYEFIRGNIWGVFNNALIYLKHINLFDRNHNHAFKYQFVLLDSGSLLWTHFRDTL
jgi:hypothetical protein